MDNPALYSVLGKRIADARSKFLDSGMISGKIGISQSELARKVGLTRGSIANIELGKQRPPLHIVWSIAQALRIEPRLLLPHNADLAESVTAVALASEKLEPAVERVVEEIPIARAWLSATRSEVGPMGESRTKRRRLK